MYARLYSLPGAAHAPAVVVAHGYLANAAFLEVPWAQDLTGLGLSALFLDRRGHGRSGGAWWPPASDGPPRLAGLYPDIRAAVAYLRRRAPLVDPARIALLGHSDGGTGAMVVASADWEVAATVSLSASLAPWEYVNHVAPRNLLLLYGRDDAFILADTDAQLMRHATRGYLGGEGRVGTLADGSARALLRIDGRGHVDVVLSAAARRAALRWLAETFGIETEVRLAPLRAGWVGGGTACLVLLVAFWNGLPPPRGWREGWLARAAKLVLIAALWAGGLAAAGWAAPRLSGVVPTQEGNVVAAVLAVESLLMGAVAVPAWWRRPTAEPSARHARGREIGRGVAAAIVVQVALEALLQPIYTTPVTAQRGLLCAAFLALAVPAFTAICAAATWVGRGRGELVRGLPVEIVLAALTALLAPHWFVRMSVLPVALLAAVLLFVAAYRVGGRRSAGAAVFAAVMYARLAASVCAFY